jgi:hypothetical protein
MAPVQMDAEERYPVYSIDSTYPGTVTIDVPDELISEWRRVQREWDEMQAQMEQLWSGYWASQPRRTPPRLRDNTPGDSWSTS